MEELTELVEAPLDDNVACIEYEDERKRGISDDDIMLFLKERYGICDGQQMQRLDKGERDTILMTLLAHRAGVRQLQRLTGIGKNIISNVSKKIY